MSCDLSQYWTPNITTIDITGTTSQQALNDARAQRVYDGAIVSIINTQTEPGQQFTPDPNDNDSLKLFIGSTQYQVRFVNSLSPQGYKMFQIYWTGGNGNFITHYNNDDVFQASGNSTDIWESYFSFQYTSTGEINNMITYSPYHMGSSYYLSPYLGPEGSNYYIKADWNNSQKTDCTRWAELKIITPSAYMQALASFNPISCCSGAYATNNEAQFICQDQALTSFTSVACLAQLQTFCTGSNLQQSSCQQYCSLTDVDCDTALGTYAQQEIASIGATGILASSTLSNLLGCFLGTSYDTQYYNSLVAQYPTVSTLPNLPQCIIPVCSSSTIKPYNVKQNGPGCPDVTSCFSVSNVTNSGSIQGNIALNQSESCSSLSQTTSATPASTSTTPATTTSATPTPTTTATPTTTTPTKNSTSASTTPASTTTPSTTIPSTTTSTSTTNLIIIVSIIVGILILGIVAYVFYKRRKKRIGQTPNQRIANISNTTTRYGKYINRKLNYENR